MAERIRFVFVSNYLNHHQIPFCRAMYRMLEGSFCFIQTEPMEEERIRMGWNKDVEEPYLRLFYQEQEACRQLIETAEVVFFGGLEDGSYIVNRLETGLPVVRYAERMYKTGQWKAISPRGLLRKYHEHTRHRNKPVYMMCSGGYVPSDYAIIHAYPNKLCRWGYFPETKQYDVDNLLKNKGWETENGEKVLYLVWAARMIDWKHPEYPLEAARYLKEKGIPFHMDIIGGGELKPMVEQKRQEYGLSEEVTLPGFLPPEQVREYMEKANVFLFTSDRQEGWGAVANEAMNSGCALIANVMIGAVPFLLKNGKNGLIYRDGKLKDFLEQVEKAAKDAALCERLGRAAYETIIGGWNAENAAYQLLQFCTQKNFLKQDEWNPDKADRTLIHPLEDGPVTPAPVISERKMYEYLQ